MYRIIIVVMLVFFISCRSERVLEGVRASKFYDEYLVLKDNNTYSVYQNWFGIKAGRTKGRYVLSGDTAYLISPRKDKNYRLYGYVLIDTTGRTLQLQYIDSFSSTEYGLYTNKLSNKH